MEKNAKRMNCFISTGIFCIIYTAAKYLLTGNVDWKMLVAATAAYAVLYASADLLCSKFAAKNETTSLNLP